MSFSVVKNNEREILRISDAGYTYSCGYYTQNHWVGDNRLLLTKYKTVPDEKSHGVDLVLVDLLDKTEKTLVHADEGRGIPCIVHGKLLYYVENGYTLCSKDIENLETKKIYKSEEEPIEHLQITADGRYINWFFEGSSHKNSKWICRRIDLKTGEVIKMLEKAFLPPFPVANHMMISPTDPDMLFFAHEGDTTYITNRLWIAPLGKEPYNIAKQRLDENGNLIDCFGHESWAPDGKGLYFIKYDVSPEPPKGIGYVDLESKEPRILFSGYKYWHVCAAPNGKLLAADIGPNDLDEDNIAESGVCLIDLEKKTETKLAAVKNTRSHPGHPHPQFSPSCKKICFHNAIDKDTLSVEIIDI